MDTNKRQEEDMLSHQFVETSCGRVEKLPFVLSRALLDLGRQRTILKKGPCTVCSVCSIISQGDRDSIYEECPIALWSTLRYHRVVAMHIGCFRIGHRRSGCRMYLR